MEKIRIYLFCKERLIEWEFSVNSKRNHDFLIRKFESSFNKDYNIRFIYNNDGFLIESTSEIKLKHNNENIDYRFILDQDILVCDFVNENSKVILYVQYEVKWNAVFYKYNIRDVKELKIGKAHDNDLIYLNEKVEDYQMVINLQDKTVKVLNNSLACYINQVRFIKSKLKFGDCIFLYGFKIVFLGDYIAINNPNNKVYCELSLLDEKDIEFDKNRRFIDFKKTSLNNCKLDKNLDFNENIISIDEPSFDFKPNLKILLLGAIPCSLVVIILVGISSFFIDYINILFSSIVILGLSFISIVLFVLNFVLNKNRFNLQIKKYNDYLNDKHKKITLFKNKIVKNLIQRHPKTIDCYNMVLNFESRVWERSNYDSNFLSLRIGEGSVPFDKVEVKSFKKSNFKDNDEVFQNYKKIVESSKNLNKSPVILSLPNIIKLSVYGSMINIMTILKDYIVQITSLHSYDDVKLCFICPSFYTGKEFYYLKEIPHFYSDTYDFRYLGFTKEDIVDVIYHIKKIIMERQDILEKKPNENFYKSYVFFVLDDCDETVKSFLKYFEKVDSKVKVYLIFLTDDKRNIPSYFNHILDIESSDQVLYQKNNGELDKLTFKYDYKGVANVIDISKYTFCLSNLRLLGNLILNNRSLEKGIFDLYNVSNVKELDILSRWNRNFNMSSVSVPIGFYNEDKVLHLNFHEKYNGSKCIVFGDAATGKTEFLKTCILSYVINFHPNILNFIVIKSNLNSKLNYLSNLPHVIGIFDKENDGDKKKILLCIKNEIQKRQLILSKFKVKDLDMYSSLYRWYSSYVKFPNIFIVIDDVNYEDVEFINEVTLLCNSANNCGIYLFVASGDSNKFVKDVNVLSKFDLKICFKLNNVNDMVDIIENGTVSNFLQSGSFNMRFSEFSIIENVSMVYSNNEFDEDSNQKPHNDENQLEVINNCGAILKKIYRFNDIKKINTYEDIIINKICDLSSKIGVKMVPIVNASLGYLSFQDIGNKSNFDGFMWRKSNSILEVKIGVIDDPKHQIQTFLNINFYSKGNVLIIGDNGTGKSITIMTIIYSLCCEYNPNYVNIYIVDLNSRDMLSLKFAPHVKGVAYDSSKMENIFETILKEFNYRKNKFRDLGISSCDMYFKRTGKTLANVFLFIDSLQDIVNEVWDYSNFIKIISRDGKFYGIYICITSNDYGSLESKLIDYFGNKVILRLKDESKYRSIFRTDEQIFIREEYKGRGLVKINDYSGSRVLECQVALPMNAKNNVELDNNMKVLFIQMKNIDNKIYKKSINNYLNSNEIIKDYMDDNCYLDDLVEYENFLKGSDELLEQSLEEYGSR